MFKKLIQKSDKAILSTVDEIKKFSFVKKTSSTFSEISKGNINVLDETKKQIEKVTNKLDKTNNRTFTVATIATGIVAPIPTLIATSLIAILANSKKDSETNSEIKELLNEKDEIPEIVKIDNDFIFIRLNLNTKKFKGHFKTGEYSNIPLKDIPDNIFKIICDNCPDEETKNLLLKISEIRNNFE